MKSIKQQYIDLKEGRMSQQNFMRNLRMTMPQYVTNVTSYGDAVKILRNKGILTESFIKQLEKGLEVEKEHGKNDVETAQIALDHLKEDPKYYSKLDKAGLEEDMDATASAAEELAKQMGDYDSAVVALQDEMGLSRQQAESIASQVFPEDEGEIEAMIKKYEEEESGKYTTGGEQFSIKEAKSKWENTSGKSMYAQFKEIDNLNGQEVLIGIDFEIEKNPELSKIEAIKLVLKNLKKNPIYYTATLMAGKEMTEIPTIGKLKPGSDQMKPVKGEDSLVDKDNGMKPAKDVEKVKASANKATKETNKPEKGISLMSLVAKASRGVEKMAATGEKMKVVKEGIDDERDFDPDVEGKPSSMFQRFASQRRGEEAAAAQAAEIHNGLKRGDKVKVNSEAAKELGINPDETFTISSFNKFRPGSLLQSIDVVLKNSAGQEVGSVNIEHVYESGATPKVDTGDVPSTIFSRNAGISQKLRSLSQDDLMEMIREELKEYFDGRDNLTDVTGENK